MPLYHKKDKKSLKTFSILNKMESVLSSTKNVYLFTFKDHEWVGGARFLWRVDINGKRASYFFVFFGKRVS